MVAIAKKRGYTASRAEANARYDAKTYKQIAIRLRVKEDEDMIESFEQAKEKGIKSREWLRQIFEGRK